ncbi:NUDIX hydrolase [Anaerorhabdus sp.]|uniref:NUDIX hydrolase n=1 Tax=Anaerorhabdus sp. TaxID=1872524 RepID=UPI002FCC31ED
MITTLCYIEKDNCYLMLHRNKKAQDINQGKWIGIGGKLEPRESCDECNLREVKEETGLDLVEAKCRGIITFVQNDGYTEYMFLFTSDSFKGELKECDEGTLRWVSKDELDTLNMWEGDRIFLDCLRKDLPFFSLKLVYNGDNLVEAWLNNEKV